MPSGLLRSLPRKKERKSMFLLANKISMDASEEYYNRLYLLTLVLKLQCGPCAPSHTRRGQTTDSVNVCDMIVLFMWTPLCVLFVMLLVFSGEYLAGRQTNLSLNMWVREVQGGRSVQDWFGQERSRVGVCSQRGAGSLGGAGEVRCLNYVSVDGKARYLSIYKQ